MGEATKVENRRQEDMLRELQEGQQSHLSFFLGWRTAIRKIMQSFGNLQTTCMEMRDSILKLINANNSILKAVRAIQSGLPSALERSLIQEPFILEDAIGRIAPVPLQFIDSWDAFQAVLEIRFRGIQGDDKVRNKEYALQDRARGFEITRARPWQSAFLPGQRVDMSFIFEQLASTPEAEYQQAQQQVTCPSCGSMAKASAEMDIEWFALPRIVFKDR